MIGRDRRLNDSSQGLGSMEQMMATGPEDEMKVPTDMIDDTEGTFQSDEADMIMQIMQSGQLTQIKESMDPRTLSDIMSMFDSAIENGTFDGTFDEFLATVVVQQAKSRNSQNMNSGIMSTMRG